MNGKKILVFGASGFIGTYLIDGLIERGFSVVASDIGSFGATHYKEIGIDFVNIDITKKSDFSKLSSFNFDVVIHLAATQPANVSTESYDPRDYINVNVNGTLNILDFAREKGAKVIYATSHRNTQGMWEDNKVISEESGRSIKYTGQYSMFSISETAAQDCVLHYQEEYGVKGIIMRLPPVYGYGPHTEIYMDGKQIKTGFQIFIEKAEACEPLEVWGDALKGRDIVYIKDVIDAFLKAIDNDTAKGLYNISSGRSLTLLEEAETIAKVYWGDDSEPKVVLAPEKKNHIDAFVYDISKAKQELDWEPKYSFEDMLIDYKEEEVKKEFSYLVDKRQKMFQNNKL